MPSLKVTGPGVPAGNVCDTPVTLADPGAAALVARGDVVDVLAAASGGLLALPEDAAAAARAVAAAIAAAAASAPLACAVPRPQLVRAAAQDPAGVRRVPLPAHCASAIRLALHSATGACSGLPNPE
jgi:hypothetical protein